MAKITWYTKLETDEEYRNSNEIYAGTYDGKTPLKICTKIWNNRWGTEDESDLENFTVKLYFEHIEDSVLLKYLVAVINGKQEIPINIISNYAVLEFLNRTVISGKKNNGLEAENKENFLQLDIKFDPEAGVNLKPDDIKNLYMEIISK